MGASQKLTQMEKKVAAKPYLHIYSYRGTPSSLPFQLPIFFCTLHPFHYVLLRLSGSKSDWWMNEAHTAMYSVNIWFRSQGLAKYCIWRQEKVADFVPVRCWKNRLTLVRRENSLLWPDDMEKNSRSLRLIFFGNLWDWHGWLTAAMCALCAPPWKSSSCATSVPILP